VQKAQSVPRGGWLMYAKVFQQIYDSSIVENPETRFTFMDFLILADRNGVVDMTHEAISRRTNRPIETIRATIAELEGPDPRSRTKHANGARIFRLDEHRDWGWGIVNYEHFRKLASEDQRREKTLQRVRKYRVTHCNAVKRKCNDSPSLSLSSSLSVRKRKPSSLEEVLGYAKEQEISRSDATGFFDSQEAGGWTRGGKPLHDWKASLRSWKTNGWLPSLKQKKNGAYPDSIKRLDKSKIDVPERFKAWVAEHYPDKRDSAMKWQTWADVPSNGLRDEWWREEKKKLPIGELL
jgi:hypothetical protein